MDTLTHTLFGWLLSRAGLERIGPWVPAVAMISANLPDVEECSHRFTTKVEYLQNYRGFSHSLAGAIGLSILAASCVWGVGRLLNKRIHQPPSFLWALLVCGIGILSHIFLDSLNSDGLRLLFPFTTDSYYGDLAFMMDPWMWLILGGSIFIGSRKSKWTRNIFLFLTATTTADLFQAVNIVVIY
jgi:inner membrane protein